MSVRTETDIALSIVNVALADRKRGHSTTLTMHGLLDEWERLHADEWTEHPDYFAGETYLSDDPARERCVCGGIQHWHAPAPYGCDDCPCTGFRAAEPDDDMSEGKCGEPNCECRR